MRALFCSKNEDDPEFILHVNRMAERVIRAGGTYEVSEGYNEESDKYFTRHFFVCDSMKQLIED